jgi:hypothetical protein
MPTTLSLNPPTAARVEGGILAFIFCLGLLTFAFYAFRWNWNLYAVIVGVLVGGGTGYLVIMSVPAKVQLAGASAVFGFSLDSGANALLKPDAPTSSLTTLATLIGNSNSAVNQALVQTGLPAISAVSLSYGLWAFVIVVGVSMAVGAAFKPK